ncbi:alpha/beta hydrolase [Microbulbifer epialgicus]|uniref:Alpha/beta hydrolase n=1 Tax=Microbulbifer epialgicus TaxID=393907 RepID=A0ABV4P3X0_9GAMM
MKLKALLCCITFLVMLTSACSSNIAYFIESSKSFPYDHIVETHRIKELGFQKDSYCSRSSGICISYLYAKPIEAKKLRYSIELEAEGSDSIVELEIHRNSLDSMHTGTVILLHGFNMSKELMIHSALYFRFLGYDVVIPDLLGHGESGGEKKYGVGDSVAINELLDELIKKKSINDGNIFLLGNSMGGLAAAYVNASREDISGLILQAPMLPFDQAANNYIKAGYPLLSRFISTSQIREGALTALDNANISVDKTQIKPILYNTKIPVLLFSSPADSVAPYRYYKDLAKDNISVIPVPDRNHPSMAVIGNAEHEMLINWFNDNR